MIPHLVAGLAFGDEGKGSTVDALVRKTGADLVIRYNGGAQCAHNVVTPEGIHHTFQQFGSGSFVPGVRTYLSRFVLVNPVTMLMEADLLDEVGVHDVFGRTSVDGKAVVITPFQKAGNRLQEICRGEGKHGSTGEGIGTTRSDHLKYGDAMLLVEDLPCPKKTREKLEAIQLLYKARLGSTAALPLDDKNPNVVREVGRIFSDNTIPYYLSLYEEWCKTATIVSEPPTKYKGLVFEGGQGMLLDETHGFQPHTTWTDVTFANAETILKEMNYTGGAYKFGVLRSYYTRHGAGPFPSEDATLSKLAHYTEPHNVGKNYTGAFRLGHFDIALAQYALHCIGGVDGLVINHTDVITHDEVVSARVDNNGLMEFDCRDFLNVLETFLKAPVSIVGEGPSYLQKVFPNSIWSPKGSSCPN